MIALLLRFKGVNSVGFFSILGIVILSGMSGSIALGAIAYYGWAGFLGTIISLSLPGIIMIRRREKIGGQFDDRLGWEKMEAALDTYVHSLKGKKDLE